MIRGREGLAAKLSIDRCCQVLEVSRSFFYKKAEPVKQEPDALEVVVLAFAEKHVAHGYRMISARLQESGYADATVKKVRRLMTKHGLKSRKRRSFVRTSIPGIGPVSPNLLKDAVLTGPKQALITDLTYVATAQGFAYVAVILDAFTRRALGYSVSRTMHTSLMLDALNNVAHNHRLPDGWIHHSDRGCQYTSNEYRSAVLKLGGRLSNSAKGNPYDNAKMESFFKTYKYEEANLSDYQSVSEVREALRNFLHDYNYHRPHSSLNYKPPVAFEMANAA